MINKSINSYIFIPVLVFLLFLQMTLMPDTFSDKSIPNIVLAALIAAAFLSDGGSLYAAFFAGYIMDIYSGKYFGIGIISFLVTVFVSIYISKYFLKDSYGVSAILSAMLAVVVYHIIHCVLMFIKNSYVFPYEIETITLSVATDILTMAIVFYPMIFIFSFNRDEK